MKTMMNKLCSKVNCYFVTREKKERGDHLIEILGTILIAIILLVIFRDKLQALFTDFLAKIVEAMENLFKGNNGGGATITPGATGN